MAVTLTRTATSIATEISTCQTAAVAAINAAIGDKRTGFITAIPGQEMIYGDKEAEALAYLALDPEPADLSGFRWMPGEIGVTATTPYELAQVWVNTAAMWRIIGPQLEHLRLGTIAQVQAATTPAAIDAILSSFTTTLQAI